jgi:hypothetical protein
MLVPDSSKTVGSKCIYKMYSPILLLKNKGGLEVFLNKIYIKTFIQC